MRKYLWYRRRRRLFRGIGILLIFVFILLLFGLAVSYMNKVVTPTMRAMVNVKVRSIATQIIYGSVNEVFDGSTKYDDLVTIQKDNKDQIAAIQSNVAKMNQISASIALLTQQKLSTIEEDKLKIPLGVFAGYNIFNKSGPDVTIKILPIGNTEVEFRSELSEAGMNQTRHRIYAEVKCRMRVVVPLAETLEEVTANVPVAETVIVGSVPVTYVNIGK